MLPNENAIIRGTSEKREPSTHDMPL